MRYSKEHKEQTREKILDAAGKVFKEQGYAGAGIEAVMREAGLTHGGFYAHFRNKKALFAEAIRHNARQLRDTRNSSHPELEGPEWIRAMAHHYLSPGHRDHVAEGCPMPPLISDLERSETQARETFESVLFTWRDDLLPHLNHLPEEERPQRALGMLITLVGGMALARAMDSEEQAQELLNAGREQIDHLLATPPSETPQ